MSTTEIMRFDTLDERTAITIWAGDEALALSVRDVIRWVEPAASPDEALKFVLICRARGLNPFLGEAHLVKIKDSWITIVDKSGWLAIAERHPAYDGHECGITVQRVLTPAVPGVPAALGRPARPAVPAVMGEIRDIPGTIRPEGWVVIGGWARVYRKDRRIPTYRNASMVEYGKDNRVWDALPMTMIEKCALVHALEGSGLVSRSGGYDAVEVPDLPAMGVESPRDGYPVPEAIVAEYQESLEDPESARLPRLGHGLAMEITDAMSALGMLPHQIEAALEKRGVKRIVELSDQQAVELRGKLHELLDRKNIGKIMLPDARSQGVDGGADWSGEVALADATTDAEEGVEPAAEPANYLVADVPRRA